MKSLVRIARKSMLLWFGAAFLVGGLVCLGMGVEGVLEEQRYQGAGRTAQAIVLAKSIQSASRDENSSTKYEIRYGFATDAGETVEGTDAVVVDTWERLEAGSRVAVMYLPDNPRANRAAGSGNWESALVAVALGSIFALIGGFFFLANARRVWRQWSILRHGHATPGTVLAIQPTSTQVNRVRQWEVRYQYHDHAGRLHEGTSAYMSPEAAHAFAPGDAMKIRFDRAHPEESVWEEPDAATAPPGAVDRSIPAEGTPPWKRIVGWAGTLALVFVVLAVGEIVVPLTGLDGFIAQNESVLKATTIGATALGFALFMSGILYRIFSGPREPLGHADTEDLLRRTRITRGQPYFARASTYRFKGVSVGSSFHDQFSIQEAKQAWKRRAWRNSSRWRGNFIIMGGALLFGAGLFSIFVVIGSNGIRLLAAAAVIYALARSVIAFVQA